MNELIWSAGFFDGEGCSSLSSGYMSIHVAQTELEPLERFQQAVELGHVNGPYEKNGNRNKLVWNYTAFGRDAIEVMEKIYPFLTSIKQKQWDETVSLSKTPRRRNFCYHDLHEMTEENTRIVVRTNGRIEKRCRACQRTRNKRYKDSINLENRTK